MVAPPAGHRSRPPRVSTGNNTNNRDLSATGCLLYTRHLPAKAFGYGPLAVPAPTSGDRSHPSGDADGGRIAGRGRRHGGSRLLRPAGYHLGRETHAVRRDRDRRADDRRPLRRSHALGHDPPNARTPYPGRRNSDLLTGAIAEHARNADVNAGSTRGHCGRRAPDINTNAKIHSPVGNGGFPPPDRRDGQRYGPGHRTTGSHGPRTVCDPAGRPANNEHRALRACNGYSPTDRGTRSNVHAAPGTTGDGNAGRRTIAPYATPSASEIVASSAANRAHGVDAHARSHRDAAPPYSNIDRTRAIADASRRGNPNGGPDQHAGRDRHPAPDGHSAGDGDARSQRHRNPGH